LTRAITDVAFAEVFFSCGETGLNCGGDFDEIVLDHLLVDRAFAFGGDGQKGGRAKGDGQKGQSILFDISG